LHPLFAAEASGLDLRRPLERDTVRAIEEAMDRYAVHATQRGHFDLSQRRELRRTTTEEV
jgi:hypothetical protein